MSDEIKSVVQEVEAPAIDPTPMPMDPMQQILQGMLAMQAKTNETLEKLSDKIDTLTIPAENTDSPKSQEDMVKQIWSSKLRQRKMYKVLIIKRVIPISPEDQASGFNNAGIERSDTNKRFDDEKEAVAFGEENAPGKYKLMTVTVPMSEWAEFKKRNINIQI